MPDIVISEFMNEAAIKAVPGKYDVYYDPYLVDQDETLKKMLKKARGLVVRNRTRVSGELLEAAPRLKVVGRLGVGLDNIDLDVCKTRGVTVCPATGANDVAVAEWVIVSAMTLLRGAFLFKTEMLAGQWPRNQAMGHETAGKMLGLVGFGQIARETAKRAQALGMVVVGYDPFVPINDPCWKSYLRAENLQALLGQADVISLHVPLNDTTHHLLNTDSLAQMKTGAVLINAARGGVVDEKALVAAMQSGRISGAALDVYEIEPLAKDAATRFEGLPNLILTPHIGGVTIESNDRVSRVTMDNVLRVLEATQCAGEF